MGRKLIALTCALVLLTAACDPDDGSGGTTTGTGTTDTGTGTDTGTETTTPFRPPPPPPSSPPPRRVDEGCTQGEPRRLQVVNVNAPAQPIQSDIVPCTDDSGSRLSLHNTGIAVWTINANLGVRVWPAIEGEDLTSLVFRQSFGYNARLLPPKRRAVVYTPPRGGTRHRHRCQHLRGEVAARELGRAHRRRAPGLGGRGGGAEPQRGLALACERHRRMGGQAAEAVPFLLAIVRAASVSRGGARDGDCAPGEEFRVMPWRGYGCGE